MTPHTEASPKLDGLLKQFETVSSQSKELRSSRNNRLRERYPGWIDSTVVRITDVDAPEVAFVGFKPQRDQPAVKMFGTSEEDEAARKREVVKRTLAGELLTDAPSDQELDQKEQRDLAACEITLEFLTREIEREKNVLADQSAKMHKPIHDKQMTALFASALDFFAKYAEAYGGKRHLIDSGVGLRDGMYHNLPESFLSAPNNPWSDMAAWFTEAKRQGFIKEVPQSLRMKVAK